MQGYHCLLLCMLKQSSEITLGESIPRKGASAWSEMLGRDIGLWYDLYETTTLSQILVSPPHSNVKGVACAFITAAAATLPCSDPTTVLDTSVHGASRGSMCTVQGR